MKLPMDVRYSVLLPLGSLVSCFFFPKAANVSQQSFESQQKGVAQGMAVGYSFSLLAFIFGNKLFASKEITAALSNNNKDISNSDLLMLLINNILPWFSLQGVSLFYGIGNIAFKRFFSSKSIAGDKTDELDIDSRYLNNTSEQVLISLIANITAIGTIFNNYNNNKDIKLLNGNLSWIILHCNIFLAGRILFYFHYKRTPHQAGKRSLGFALTWGPTVLTLMYSMMSLVKNQIPSMNE